MVRHSGRTPGFPPKGLALLYEDRDILVVDKPPGLLTISTDTEKSRTVYHILMDYVRKGQEKSRKRIFIVHRLDRETSGVLLFAKTPDAKVRLQGQWQDTHKKYFAVVHGTLAKTSEIISTHLAENRAHVVYSTSDARRGRLAKTAYSVLEQAPHAALLEIDLLTGRKHQIRVHLAGIGHPIVGDKKYGRDDRESSRLALHASSISFLHPFDGTPMTLETPLPASFRALMRAPVPRRLPSRRPASRSRRA
jgi:tRNA pseudouridine32 synthase/23S rRNA pseudouridine746 synthase/23S rRNA pseudouridine1911/1915/1917 synthase